MPRYRRNSDVLLRQLERRIQQGDNTAVPPYIYEHLRTFSQPPQMKWPYIQYRCHTHQKTLQSRAAYSPNECPKTIYRTPEGEPWGREYPLDEPCDIEPVMGHIDDWVNWIKHENNLFAFKKNHYPDPTSREELLSEFYAANSHRPSWMMFSDVIRDYFEGFLGKATQIIAELNILPRVPDYPLQAISWDELVELTNLRTDLVNNIGRGQRQGWMSRPGYNRNLGFLSENASPLTIIRMGTLRQRGEYRGVPQYTRWNSHGIIIDKYTKEPVAPVRYAVFG